MLSLISPRDMESMKCSRISGTVVFFSQLLFAATLFAQGSQASSADHGAQQFVATCAGCHGLDGAGSAKGASIIVPRVIALSDADLVRIVRDGVPGKGMPGSQLANQEIQGVVRYLRTLQQAAAASPDPGIPAKSPANAEPVPTIATTATQTPAPKSEVPAKPATLGIASIDVQQSDLNQKEVKENWVSYNGDYTGRRYSSMDEVTPANVAHLKTKWVFQTKGAGIMQVTPVVVAGVMFITRSNDAWALDAKTGKQLWHHERAVSSGLIDDASGHINRGVAILGTRVYMETDNAHLLCLDARTGSQIWDVAYATGNKNYGATSAPLIVQDKVLVGTSGGDDGVRGFLAAFDAQTGKEAWRFWTIPAPGEKGSESWPGDLYLHGGGTTWMPGTYDPELNTIYWGTSNPSPDFDGSVRPGDDLYTSSLLALDPDTGKLKWHFQYNPHDLYDYDGVQTPVLIDTTFKGQPRKLVVTANRNGFLYILDRTNGKYLFSKQFSPSQNWARGIDQNGRPISNHLIPDEQGVTVCPGYSGATNWYSPSYDPATHIFYFRSLEACSLFKGKTEPFTEGEEYYSTGAEQPKGNTPNAGYINAFDLTTLDFAWRNQLVSDGQSIAGVMSTAGGLAAFGNDAGEFEIDDAHTGKRLWAAPLGQRMHASPMSYGIAGKQYFAVAAGDNVFSFALP
jgi:alcohol dehydrogenase (cytochrome c)